MTPAMTTAQIIERLEETDRRWTEALQERSWVKVAELCVEQRVLITDLKAQPEPLAEKVVEPKVLAEGAGAVWADGTGWTVFTANVSNYLADKYHDFVPVTIIARKQG